jgi:hypothetical protein
VNLFAIVFNRSHSKVNLQDPAGKKDTLKDIKTKFA